MPEITSTPVLPDRYRVERTLGRGQQKEVLLAKDLRLERSVAIGIIHSDELDAPDFDRLFEARTMAKLGDHPHVVPIYDILEPEGSFCIVSQYLPGGDLARSLLQDGNLSISTAVRVGIQIASALEYAHTHGVTHRDLKPGNIFLDNRGNAMLGDFGLSLLSTAQTQTGEVAGTPLYMAPEVGIGQGASSASDLYSLGCLIFELVSGKPPFDADNPFTLQQKHHREQPPELFVQGEEIPEVLSDLVRQLLEKQPELRPESATAVRIALEGVLSAMPRNVRPIEPGGNDTDRRLSRNAFEADQQIVQRSAELLSIEQALLSARAGRPGLVLVRGESGIGKSRLLREGRSRAHRDGVVTLFGQGYDDLKVPYRPISEALMPLATQLGGLGEAESQVIRNLIDLGASAPRPNTEETEESERHRLSSHTYDALRALGERKPILLIIDDFQWVDTPTFDLLERFANRILSHEPGVPFSVALVVSYRDADLDERSSDSLKRLRQTVGAIDLELEGFDLDGTRTLLRQLGIREPAAQLVDRIQALTNGNPRLVQDALTQLRRESLLEEAEGYTFSSQALDRLRLPSSDSHPLLRRADSLSKETSKMLATAACIGTRFSLQDLATVSGQDSEEVLDRLEEADRAGLVDDLGQAFRFAHPMIRQALYQNLSLSRRQRIHFEIAKSLQSSAGEEAEPTLEIAHHLIRSGDAAPATQTARFASRAAALADQSFAWSEAAGLLEAAIDHADDLPAIERGEFHRRAGFAHYRLFDTGPCLHHFDEAIRIFQQSDDTTGLARALNDRLRAELQSGKLSPGESGNAAQLEESLERLDSGERPLRARILGTLAESRWQAGEATRAEQLATEAVAIAKELEDDALCVDNTIRLALSLLQRLRIRDALNAFEDGLVHAKRSGDMLAIEHCSQRIAFTLYTLGEIEPALAAIRDAESANRVTQSPADLAFSLAIHATLASVGSDLAEIEPLAERCLELVRKTQYVWSAIILLPALAFARAARGEIGGAHEAINQFVEPGSIFDDPGPWRLTAEQYRALIDADATTEPAVPVLSEPLDFAVVPSFCTYIEVCDLRNDPPRIEVIEALERGYESGIVMTLGWPFYVPRVLGVAMGLVGEWSRAEDYFEQALAGCKVGPVERSRIEVDRVRMKIRRGEAGFHEKAAALLTQSRDSLAKGGASALARRVDDLLEEFE